MSDDLGSVLKRTRTVLFAHAHPDDETLATGALIADLVARRIEVVLVSATRGERGEVVDGPLRTLAGTAALAAHREAELTAACAALGITAQYWLGTPPAARPGTKTRYVDSGMRWVREGLAGPADDVRPDAFSLAPLDAVAGDLAALIEQVSPDLLISYDHGGGYGHPDHLRMHEAALAAAARTGTPLAEIVHHREALDPDHGDAVWFDLEHRLPEVARALREHASQLTVDGAQLVHSGGQREEITTSVGLRLRSR